MASGHVEVYRDSGGRWRWRHVAGNGKIDNASEQGYARRWYAKVKARARYPLGHIKVVP